MSIKKQSDVASSSDRQFDINKHFLPNSSEAISYKIKKAESAGFCFGVNRAINMVDELLKCNVKVCTLGPIIHNMEMVRELQQRGCRPVDDINELTKEMSFRKLNNMIMTIEEARKNIKSNVSWAMTLRVMLMGFMEG